MGKFDYRVARRVKEENIDYIIILVSYEDDGTISHYVAKPSYPFGRDTEELGFNVDLYQKALDKPILELTFKDNKVSLGELNA